MQKLKKKIEIRRRREPKTSFVIRTKEWDLRIIISGFRKN